MLTQKFFFEAYSTTQTVNDYMHAYVYIHILIFTAKSIVYENQEVKNTKVTQPYI